jgi:hypothetical protein
MRLFTAPKLTAFSAYLVAAILVLIPFHALITVWLGSTFGGYDWWRLWKEALLVVLATVAAYHVCADRALWRSMRRGPLWWAIAAYVALHIIAGLIALITDQVNETALAYALVVNLRFLVFFVAVYVIAAKTDWLWQYWKQLLLIPATAVVLFGMLQAFVLPADILRHAGYGAETIQPYQTIDQKETYVRIQSTLRGSNPLGAYAVVIVSALAAILMTRMQSRRWRLVIGGLLVVSLVVLAATYSRSAYIGVAVSLMAMCLLMLRSAAARRWLLVISSVLVLVGLGMFAVLRQNDRFENTFFHTDETSQSPVSSNDARLGALRRGAEDVLREPLGRGPGTAGPASQHNDRPVRIAENYYLQIGQEVGWLGLGLFIIILWLVARALWRQRVQLLPALLFTSLLGISVINLLSHAWTDDTLSLIWWGLAGIALAPAILKKR